MEFTNPKTDGIDEKTAGRVRAAQIQSMTRITPLMMATNIINAIIISIAFSGTRFATETFIWASVLCIMAAYSFYDWHRVRNRPEITTVSPRGIRKAAINSTILGAMWGVLPILFYDKVDPQGQMVMIAFMGGMLGGGCLALNIIPSAMFGYLFSLSSFAVIGLLKSGTPADFAILALFAMYNIALWKSGYSLAKGFVTTKISEYQIEEQSSTIGLLLKDFEENAHDWIWETDKNGMIGRGLDQFSAHVDESFTDLIKKAIEDGARHRCGRRADETCLNKLRSLMENEAKFADLVLHVTNSQGASFWFELSGKPQYDAEGKFVGYRGVASDVTENKLSEERIAFLAHNDALTGLVNRANFNTAVDLRLEAMTDNDDPFAILYLDLDGFKLINDTKGHGIGDQLLVEVGRRVRKMTGEHDLVARLGGDEFAIMLSNPKSMQHVSLLAEKLIASVSERFEFNNEAIQIGVSIGVAMAPTHGNTREALINAADLALYRAKEEGKGMVRFFEIEMDEVVRERRLMEQELRDALTHNEMKLHYQPLVHADTKEIMGFEALLRWCHPTRGIISPNEFIPLAERTGLIVEIGDWVLREACRAASLWPDHLAVAVNLSPHQFQSKGVVNSVRLALDESGIEPSRLELEITEGLFMESTDEVVQQLTELRAMGTSISLDDFGTGYSSLSYLLKFPFDKLKIDKSFVMEAERDETAKDILSTIAALGNILNLTVTAEGVERKDQLTFLNQVDCQQFQGFLFGRPLTEEGIAPFLMKTTADRVAGKKRRGTPGSKIKKAG